MFKDISGITYDGGDPGRAFGGGIYGASCNVGFSNAPTKITLSVVSENGDYDIDDDDMDVTSGGAKTIEVGDIKFHNMYLYAYTFNDTPSAKTLTVQFIDQSICLDKIFVGLAMRHGTSSANDQSFYGHASFGGWNFYNPQNTVQVTAFSQTYEFRLMCLECNSLRPRKYQRPSPNEPAARITRMAFMAGDGTPCGGDGPLNTHVKVERGQPCVDGGYMLLGKEGFTETPCEIPKVEYDFEELCSALDWMLGGNPVELCGDINYKHNLRNFKRSATYTASYTGTLREVLSAWAADFSFDFSFDYTKEEIDATTGLPNGTPDLWIEGVDLEDPLDLTPVKTAIKEGFGADSEGGLIRNKTETHTLENTYKQSPLVKYIKPQRPFLRNQKVYNKAVGKVLKLEDAVGNRANLGRSWEELYTSIALAKYQPAARITWLSDVARKKWTDYSWKNSDPYPVPCKECPGWASDVEGAGDKKYSSEYECIKDGAGTGETIPNNQSLPGEVWYNYDIQPDPDPGKWGKAKVKQSDATKYMYNMPPPDCPETRENKPLFFCKGPITKGAVGLAINKSERPGWQNPTWRTDVPWMSLGFFPEKRILNPSTKVDLLKLHEEARTGKNKKPFAHPIWDKVENYDVFIGIWNKAFQQKVEEYDRDVADNFLGKYAWWYGNRTNEEELTVGVPPNFGPINPPASVQRCPKWLYDYEAGAKHRTFMYKFVIETSPESKTYSGNSYPFIEVLKVNDYVFGDNGRAPLGDDSDPCTYCPERAIFEIEDNTWGTPQEVIDDLFTNHYIVNYPHSSAMVRPESLIAMSDIEEYVPIYAAIKQDRMIHRAYEKAGIRAFEKSVYRPEDAPSGYFPGIAFIPNMDRATGVSGLPILKVDYEHWSCPTTPPPTPGVTTTTPSPSSFCLTGCPPCVCDDTVVVNGVEEICGAAGSPVPEAGVTCLQPCWDCLKASGKQYGTIRSIGAPPGTTYPTGPIDKGGDGTMPNYEPSNPAWQECLVMGCAEDYGYCEKGSKIVGYPTERKNDDDNMVPAMDKTTCEGLPNSYTPWPGINAPGAGVWMGEATAADCEMNRTLDVKVSVNNDPSACACWECTMNKVGQGVFVFGDETKAKKECNSAMGLVQKDEVTVTAGSGCASCSITINVPSTPACSITLQPVVVPGNTPEQNDIATAAEIVNQMQPCISGITGASILSFGTKVVTFQFPMTPCPLPATGLCSSLVNNGKVTASTSGDAGATTSSSQGVPPGVVRVLSQLNCGQQGPEGPCPTGGYLSATEIRNAMVYQNTRRRKHQWLTDNTPPKDCTLWCEEDIVKTVCGCDPVEEPIHHFTNYRARYLKITHLAVTKKIIFPIEHDYRGFWMTDATEKGYYPQKQIVIGTPPTSAELKLANVMETRIVDVDVTQDLDTIEMGGDSGKQGAYQERLVVNNPYNLDPVTNLPIPEVVSLPTYYTFMKSVNKSADKPNQTINIKVDGTEFDKLKTLLKPASGLSSFTVSVGSDGIATDLTYISRPAKLPKRDVLLQKIGPRAIEGRIPKPAVNTIMNDWNVT